MEIKTITCHDVYNVGASLQAYALQKYLSDLGHNVKIIDYKPDYLSKHYSLLAVSNPKFDKKFIRELYLIAKLPFRLKAKLGKRKRNFDLFSKRYLKLTRRYGSLTELELDPPEADVYFAGSDQIWNTLFPNGKDGAFYLSFAPHEAVKASYAASFAVENIPDDLKMIIHNRISDLDYVSVRELSGLDILKSLGIKTGVQVLDPVFLLKKEDWNDILQNGEKWCEQLQEESYILVYDFDRTSEMELIAKKIAKATNCKIFSVFNMTYADKSFEYAGPLEVLSLIKNAQIVLSNSFHATAFAIIFKKQFWVLERREKINSRMRDLLTLLHLSDRLINDVSREDLERIYYYENAMFLETSIEKSKNYINQVLIKGKK